MKRLHRKDLYCWSTFYEPLNIDFHGIAWIRKDGNVVIDPVVMSEHDLEHLQRLGGAAWILLTNSDHVRDTAKLVERFGAQVIGPRAERDRFPLPVARWLGEGETPFPSMRVLEMHGSKTPGELALVLDEDTLITGDLVRAHRAGSLMMLSEEQGLKDRERAVASIERLRGFSGVRHVLVNDGWQLFHDAPRQLELLMNQLRGA